MPGVQRTCARLKFLHSLPAKFLCRYLRNMNALGGSLFGKVEQAGRLTIPSSNHSQQSLLGQELGDAKAYTFIGCERQIGE